MRCVRRFGITAEVLINYLPFLKFNFVQHTCSTLAALDSLPHREWIRVHRVERAVHHAADEMAGAAAAAGEHGGSDRDSAAEFRTG